MYICMNNTLYTCINKYNFNFSKMITDTELEFSPCTKLLTSYRLIYHLYL